MEHSIHVEGGLEITRESAMTVSNARRIASWLLFLCILSSILILWGGIVRLSGSGLSIPDWPIINGSFLPPFTQSGWQSVYDSYAQEVTRSSGEFNVGIPGLGTFKTMFAIEYFHRFLAALVVIVFLAIFVRAIRMKDVWPRTRSYLIAALILLFVQAGLGGIVVKTDLQAVMVAAHLGTAFVFLGVLIWATMMLAQDNATVHSERKRLRRLAWITTGTAYLQILFGGLMAGTGAGLLLNTWPTMAGWWVPPGHLLWADWFSPRILNLVQNQVFIQFVHRWLAWIVVAHVVALILRGMRVQFGIRARVALRGAATILALQMLLGIGTLLMKAPFWMSFAHLATGLTLFIILLIITHEASYAPATVE
jgi:cytochrome c oxidase assembly protein subunit 15